MNQHCRDNQMALCYAGGRTATIQMMANSLERLTRKRTDLVQAWRDAGKTDEAWSPIDELDKVIDSQEKILLELEANP